MFAEINLCYLANLFHSHSTVTPLTKYKYSSTLSDFSLYILNCVLLYFVFTCFMLDDNTLAFLQKLLTAYSASIANY